MNSITSLSDAEWLALVRDAILMPDAPPHLVAHALALWQGHRAAQQPAQGAPVLPRRWRALLSFDSWAAAPAVGMRALPAEVRQMLFAAAGCDIDLRIAPLAEGFDLSGQLLGPDARGSVELAALGRSGAVAVGPSRRVVLDAQCEFRIHGVDRGSYRVTLRLEDDEIVLPTIDVGPPRDAGAA
jgi:hypothetical protein